MEVGAWTHNALPAPHCKPMLLWNDGAGDAPCQHTTQYWDAPKFRSWVYNESPVRDSIVINDRCGLGCVGDYITGNDRWAVWCTLSPLPFPPLPSCTSAPSLSPFPHTVPFPLHSLSPQSRYTPGHLVNNKWESAFTIQALSWGYDRRDVGLGLQCR